MTKRLREERIILIIGVSLIGLLLIFPPFEQVRKLVKESTGKTQLSQQLEFEQQQDRIGFHFFLDRPSPQPIRDRPTFAEVVQKLNKINNTVSSGTPSADALVDTKEEKITRIAYPELVTYCVLIIIYFGSWLVLTETVKDDNSSGLSSIFKRFLTAALIISVVGVLQYLDFGFTYCGNL